MKKQLFAAAVTAGLLFTSFNGTASAHEKTYKVSSGDTLYRIALNNNLSVSQIMEWNKLSTSSIYVGQTLTLLAPHTHETTTTTSSTYTVKAGDTLWGIATRNGMTVDQLKALNNLTTNTLYVGQVLKLSGTAPTTTSNSTTINALIAESKKYIGVPYVWGGSTPSGFDCSGYLNYVFAKVGVSIPRTVETIWGATKSVSAPRVGDLVFFTTYKAGPSHAGIYLGNNQFIHASSSQGVTISDMNNTYWKSRYLGARTTF
ncbi:peptidoglycan endopeptidase [Bacillus sp. Y1]|nr:C40 family peptidase [Bacillus sp. Y1]AYA76348.1 peptidoglycan endopeptidase [Bacillus sp. Y1]